MNPPATDLPIEFGTILSRRPRLTAKVDRVRNRPRRWPRWASMGWPTRPLFPASRGE